MKGNLPIRVVLSSVAVLAGLVALYNVLGYLYNLNQGTLACALHPVAGSGSGGIVGVLVPGLFALASIALLVAVLWAMPARDAAGDRTTLQPCPHCGRGLEAGWTVCPFCGQSTRVTAQSASENSA